MNELTSIVVPILGFSLVLWGGIWVNLQKDLRKWFRVLVNVLLLFIISFFIWFLISSIPLFSDFVPKPGSVFKKVFKHHENITNTLTPENNKPLPVTDSKVNQNRFDNYSYALRDDNDGVRLRALKNFYILACEDPSDFLSDVCNVFCSHIRNKTEQNDYKKRYEKTPSVDIQYIIDILFKKDSIGLIFEKLEKHLNCAYLVGADFNYAILNNVFFDEAILHKAKFDSASISNTNFKLAEMNTVIFDNADIKEKVSFEEAKLSFVHFRNFKKKTLKDVNFQKSKIFMSSFLKSSLSDVNFQNARIEASNFDEAVMTNVSFRNDTLKGVSFRQVSYSKVDFTNAKFFKSDLWTKIKPKKEDAIFTGTIFENDNISKIFSYDYTIRRNNK